MSLDLINTDKRPAKNGWFTGWYCCKCRNCGKGFSGAKGAWTCSDCAYDFDEQLQYEQLWRDLGWAYNAEYLTRKLLPLKSTAPKMPEFKATKENLLKLVESANNTSSDGLFVDTQECDVCIPYNPKGICAPMQPIGSCINCGKPKAT